MTNQIPATIALAMRESASLDGGIVYLSSASTADVLWMKKTAIDIFRTKDGRIVYHGEHVYGSWRISRFEEGVK